MFYWLLYPFKDDISFFRIFGYTTFRMVMAALTALLISYFIGKPFIRYLKRLKFGEEIRNDGPASHHSKAGTPTMGGLMFMSTMSISLFFWGNFSNHFFMMVWIGTLLFSLLGFIDDYSKSVLKVHGGMKAKVKLFFQFAISAAFAALAYFFPYSTDESTMLYLPFVKDPIIDMGILAILFWMFVITGTSNAVNLTDGLDGLATGVSVIVLATLAVFAYLTGVLALANYLLLPFIPEVNETSVFLAALIGAAVGFLWFNSYPAEVFMGDTGSLALGGAIGMVAVLIKKEVLLLILGGIFVAEVVSVFLQVSYYKMTKKRIFKMAPLHHHFELSGWHENKVVARFLIVGLILALVSLSSLKIQ